MIRVVKEKSEAQRGAGACPRSQSPDLPRMRQTLSQEKTLTAIFCPVLSGGAEDWRVPGTRCLSPADRAESPSTVHGPTMLYPGLPSGHLPELFHSHLLWSDGLQNSWGSGIPSIQGNGDELG